MLYINIKYITANNFYFALDSLQYFKKLLVRKSLYLKSKKYKILNIRFKIHIKTKKSFYNVNSHSSTPSPLIDLSELMYNIPTYFFMCID